MYVSIVLQRLTASFSALHKIKREILLFILLYSASLAIGYSFSSQTADQTKSILDSLLSQEPFVTLGSLVSEGNLAAAIALTFAFNLSVGAFLTTTLPNVVPVVGPIFTIFVAAARGILIGAAYTPVIAASPQLVTLAFGTILLEFGAYVISSAVGFSVALRFLAPKRYSYPNRRAAFLDSWRLVGRVYVVVAILLIGGAFWEMTGIFVLGRFGR